MLKCSSERRVCAPITCPQELNLTHTVGFNPCARYIILRS
jgi:hypothetical protein